MGFITHIVLFGNKFIKKTLLNFLLIFTGS
jgi:hypothetical protein